jgi:uncharacterized protein YkwD
MSDQAATGRLTAGSAGLVRAGVVAVLAVALATAMLGVAPSASAQTTWLQAENSMRDKLNAERAAAGLPELAVNSELSDIARQWSQEMADRDEMLHNPDLQSQVTTDWSRLGENVGYTVKTDATNAELVRRLHEAFMNSAKHRANILGDEWNQVGIGVVKSSAEKMWVTVDFMKAPLATESQQGGSDDAELVNEAVGVSRTLFAGADSDNEFAGAETDSGRAEYVVLSRSDLFADALAGAGLAGESAPVLFTPGPSSAEPNPPLAGTTREEINRVLGGSGTVYVLGGPTAVSSRAAESLAADGYNVQRLAGPSRVETSVEVAREALARRGASGEVLIARSDKWADAVTGGAYAADQGSPVVLTGSKGLHPAVDRFLDQRHFARRWALGGDSALADQVVQTADAQRVAGPTRAATAAEIAKRLWGRTSGSDGDAYAAMPGYHEGGWAYALAYSPLSAIEERPQLLVAGDTVPASVTDYLTAMSYGDGSSAKVLAASVVDDAVATRLAELAS